MPHRSSGPRARKRGLGLVTSALVVAGLVAAVPSTGASGTAANAAEPTAGRGTPLTPGRYIVVMTDPSATQQSARSGQGGAFRASSQETRSYAARLRSQHTRLAREVGTDVAAHYTMALNGFAADLTKDQAIDLSSDRRVLLLEKDGLVQADTWNTPQLLGLSGKNGVWAKHGGRNRAGAGTVIGVIDSGIWPESKSFRGARLTEQPRGPWDISRQGGKIRVEKADGGVFMGECQTGEEWTADDCNAKLVGARYYADGLLAGGHEIGEDEYVSPRDGGGHGTHTASTAAGKPVQNVRVEGQNFGEVVGMAPGARIAAYKALWEGVGGTNSDILSAVDDAVTDGVDVINFSVSGALDTAVEATELAFEGAAEAGIVIAASAGNSGPEESTVAHNSPWVITVAASTHTSFENTLVLGDGKKLVGASIARQGLPKDKALVFAGDSVVSGGDAEDAALCGPDTLDPAKVGGTIVVCLRGAYDRVAKSAEVDRAGGVGMVLVNPSENSLDADFHSVPTIHVDVAAGEKVLAYLDSAGAAAEATFVPGNTTGKTTPLPQISGFSSRGPSLANDADILKPDLAAPGSSVLAAVSPPSNSGRDYDLYSGTSMAAPHIAGLAAMMSAERPRWTPQQIQSAMMTTATPLRNEKGGALNDATAQGSGQVTPKRFFDPGLFVTATLAEWRGYLAGQGLQLNPNLPAADLAARDLNLPSIARGQLTTEETFTRRFTATRPGTWRIAGKVRGFEVTMDKTKVVSKRRGDSEDVRFTFTRTTAPFGRAASGWIKLTGPTTVRLPVALRPVNVRRPLSVRGSGAEGSVGVTITPAFDGMLDLGVTGLAVSETVTDDVTAGGETDIHCVTVAEGSKAARFAIDAADDTADLDMTLYAGENCDTPDSIFAIVGEAATPTGDESLTLFDPEPGVYWVEVSGFSAGEQGNPITYDLDFWDVNPASEAGGLTATPNPVPVTDGQETTFEVSWSGLEQGRKYLGTVDYEGSLSPTLVFVTG